MPDLFVDLDGIDGFADNLDRLRAAFDASVADIAGPARLADQAGGPDLGEALHEFAVRWAAGREVLTSYFQALSDMARASSAKLRSTDTDLAHKASVQ